MPVFFYYPQLADSTKKHDFSSDQAPVQEPQVNNKTESKPDSSSTATKKKKKKEEERENKKESKEKKRTTEVKTETAVVSKDSLKSAVIEKSYCPWNALYDTTSALKNQGPPRSFFTGHELPAEKKNETIKMSPLPFWISLVILSVFISFVWIRTSYGKRFSRTIAAFINIREFFQLVREEYSMTNGLSVVLSLIYVFTASIFIYQVNVVYHIFAVTTSSFVFYLSITGIVSAVFLIKLLLVRVIGLVFYTKSDQAMPFVYNIFLTNNIIGLLLIPVALMLSYMIMVPREMLIYITSAIILGLYIYRIFRALAISSNESGVSNMYFFSYLCTLDFVPFIVLLKQLDTRF